MADWFEHGFSVSKVYAKVLVLRAILNLLPIVKEFWVCSIFWGFSIKHTDIGFHQINNHMPLPTEFMKAVNVFWSPSGVSDIKT